MKVASEKLGDSRIRLEVTASAKDVSLAFEQASIIFANTMGLAPQANKTVAEVAKEKLGIGNLDAVVGLSAYEALVNMALAKMRIIPAFMPKTQPQKLPQRGRELSFTFEVTPKPAYELTSYEPVEITVPEYAFDSSLVDAQLEEYSKRYAVYENIDPRPLRENDVCFLAIKCVDSSGMELKGIATEGRTYVMGQNFMPEGFDAGLVGMSPGETKTFSFEAPAFDDPTGKKMETVQCTVTVKEVQKEVYPKIDDEWVKTYMPLYRSADELRKSVEDSLKKQSRESYDAMLLQAATMELASRFEGNIDDDVYGSMMEDLKASMGAQARQQGQTLEEAVKQSGGEQQFTMMLAMQAREALVQGYALDAVYRREKLSINDADIEAVCHSMNPQVNPKQLREQLEGIGQGLSLRESAERHKASRWVLDHAKISYIKAEE